MHTTTTELPGLVNDVRTLPTDGTARDRQLSRLIDLHASADAAAALHAAAAATGRNAGVTSTVLSSAGTVLRGCVSTLAPEDALDRERFRTAVNSIEFLSLLPNWTRELRLLASAQPESGACTIASALELWSWTFNYFRTGEGSFGPAPSTAMNELLESLPALLAARALALEVTLPGATDLRRDLAHVYAAHVASSLGATCAELVFGYRRHLSWDADGCSSCFDAEELTDLEAIMPGIDAGAGSTQDVVGPNGWHPAKAGPCAKTTGIEPFVRLRNRLDGCLTGARIAKDRAAAVIARPEGNV